MLNLFLRFDILSNWTSSSFFPYITIPEIGTIRAKEKPYVILTSNRTRELSEAIRRRCIFLWLDYPGFEKELLILQKKVPDCDNNLTKQI